MRICVLTPVFPPYASGMGGAAARIVEEMGKRGNEVVVVTPEYRRPSPPALSPPAIGFASGEWRAGLEGEGDRICVRGLKPRWTFGNAAWMGSLEGAIPSDTEVVHLHWPFIGVVRALVKWKRRHPQVPVVVTYHMDLLAPELKGRLFGAYVKLALPKVVGVADRIVVTSFDYARESQIKPLLTKEGLGEVDRNPSSPLPPHLTSPLAGEETSGRGGVVEIPLGVDTSRFSPGPKDPALMARYGLTPEDRVILTVAALDRAHAFKGIEVVLEAMVSPSPSRPARHSPEAKPMAGGERVWGEGRLEDRNDLTSPLPSPSKEREKYKLLIVGDGDLRLCYERLARRLGIADRVVFAGRVSDAELPAHYRLADAYVLASTSRSEAFGLSALEAMSSGVPVVASDLAGVRKVVRPGVTGLLVPACDVRALVAAIRRLFEYPVLREGMRKMGRQRAVEQYSWERVGGEYERVFEAVGHRT